jgi:hypothetical protein
MAWVVAKESPSSRSGLGSARFAYDRFRARELLLELLNVHTNAWTILKQQAQSAGAQLPSVANTDSHISMLVERQWQVGSTWARLCNISTDWVRIWVFPAIPESWLLPALPRRLECMVRRGCRVVIQAPPWLPREFLMAWQYAEPDDELPCDPIVECLAHEGEGGYFFEYEASGAASSFTSASGGWRSDEFPPHPFEGDTRTAFMGRMAIAWRRRAEVMEAAGLSAQSAKRKLERHALWFIHYQVLRRSYEQISDDFIDLDLSTIRKGIGAFSRLVDVPLRK